MTGDRRKFRREGEERRREALIAAALDLVAQAGIAGATVRAIADRAGVTPGLIRHYFASKEELTLAAYSEVMRRMTEACAAAVAAAPRDPRAQLAAFVVANLRPPVADPVHLGVWAGYMHRVRSDPALRDRHRASYLEYRNYLQALIGAALPAVNDPARLQAMAIACNAVIDGLWVEVTTLPDDLAWVGVEAIALDAVGAITGLNLREST